MNLSFKKFIKPDENQKKKHVKWCEHKCDCALEWRKGQQKKNAG